VNLRIPKTYTKNIKTVWRTPAHDAGTYGTSLLESFLGKSRLFSFPKSVYATRDALAAVCRDRPDALILDFFAGSGTTLHATCLLNQVDGGNRRCILVTNNEVEEKQAQQLRKQGYTPGHPEYDSHGIFEAVARPRIEAALTGKRSDGTRVDGKYLDGRAFSDGFKENCEFFRLDYLHPDKVELGRAFDAQHPLLWLKAGARSARLEKLKPKDGFAIVENAGYAVRFDEAAMPELVAALNAASGVDHVFLRTDSEDAYAEMCELLGRAVTTERLYADYLDEFRRGVRREP
jgi:adenine-specific DNA-methyltransferase